MNDSYLKSKESFIIGGLMGKKDLSSYIYKYLKFDRICSFLTDKAFSFSRISEWEDVYENWFLKSKILLDNISLSYHDYQNRFYGMCWTFNRISDAMWRIYSPEKNGVRITITIEALLDAAMEKFSDNDNSRVRSGEVKYYSLTNLRKIAKEINPNIATRTPNIIAMNSLLQKRNAFSHESEFRVLLENNDTSIGAFPKFPINIDSISSILFDPRIRDDEFMDKKKIIRGLGYRNRISKSSLYTFSELNIGE